MATILQSKLATGEEQAPQTYGHGIVASYLAEYTIPTGATVATTDIIEMGVLPGGCRIVAARVFPTGDFGVGNTSDVGIMSGDVGSTDSTRTSGDELFDGVTLTASAWNTSDEALLVAPVDNHRSIGVKFSASVTGAGQVFRLQVFYAQ